ncbi:2-amino-4-hydroxy-6-hydroxymethyldihydropteridinepyrophosphokinase [Ruegeria denitrificans]|uniref:2-amino-4-hydroxy-6-hydroxymethyldihydropteridine pyrophosphokinase n=1 Tax=Ruegeria denitrificans TaxID=1715692 RepID=A0A0P1IJG4_9RHOB|nr:2-amino-4-hydroxy-6-hydroxymethyldihydropteridine diphosphokinase [Ruegeria denitrificans]CUK16302.1 2-amino-4-hydroxy-6-hydroxymethyldihydropteridinepyrophosphokinase [Ruegeria denitrificans]
MSNFSSKAVIALGANLNLRSFGPKVTLQRALDAILRQGVVIRAVSRFFETPCFPAGAGPDYVNAAALIETGKTPGEVLKFLHEVEHEFGRERVQRWGMRTLDLDLVCYEDRVLPDREEYDRWLKLAPEDQKRQAPEQLILPHPRLQDRAFVLVPMADVAPDWRHPVLGRTVTEMVAGLPTEDVEVVTPL